ncbi:hypothetical protein M405DRAFT_834270, partial [Rhizopogon salebrosus TDB-379]
LDVTEAVRKCASKWLYKLRPTHARHGNETLLDINVPLQEQSEERGPFQCASLLARAWRRT